VGEGLEKKPRYETSGRDECRKATLSPPLPQVGITAAQKPSAKEFLGKDNCGPSTGNCAHPQAQEGMASSSRQERESRNTVDGIRPSARSIAIASAHAELVL